MLNVKKNRLGHCVHTLIAIIKNMELRKLIQFWLKKSRMI